MQPCKLLESTTHTHRTGHPEAACLWPAAFRQHGRHREPCCEPARSQKGGAREVVPGEPMSGKRASAWGEAPSAERGDVGLEWCEKEACLGGGRLPWAGSLGRSTLRLLKSRPGGITLIRGIMRPARRLARSTASSFTSYLHHSIGLSIDTFYIALAYTRVFRSDFLDERRA